MHSIHGFQWSKNSIDTRPVATGPGTGFSFLTRCLTGQKKHTRSVTDVNKSGSGRGFIKIKRYGNKWNLTMQLTRFKGSDLRHFVY